jgi:hypothetical protein
MKKVVFLGLLAISLVFIGCPDPGTDPVKKIIEEVFVIPEPVVFTMKFVESEYWNSEDGNREEWGRWYYDYQNEDNLFDLADALDNDKVYVFTYSFYSDTNVNSLGAWFVSRTDGWKSFTDWRTVKGNINKNTKYSGKVIYFPNDDASEAVSANTVLCFDMGNRTVNTPTTLSFTEFKIELVDKEEPGLDNWTIGDKELIIETENTFAETVVFDNSNVLHIKPLYGSYGDNSLAIQYDLKDYAGKTIKIEMSLSLYLKSTARIAWQINSRDPTNYYPVVCGRVEHDPLHPSPNSGSAYTPNTWHHITGSLTYTVPAFNADNNEGRLLYLSGMQLKDAEAYLADLQITITENSPVIIDDNVVYEMTFHEEQWEEDDGLHGWFEPGHESWDRWAHEYQDGDTQFDLATMFTEEKVYVFTYSFSSNIDVNGLQAYFRETDTYKAITDYMTMNVAGKINKNTKYSGRIAFVPNDDASGCAPDKIELRFGIGNRDVSTTPVLSFYEFKLEQLAKTDGLEEWTISGKEFTIVSNTFAEELTTFETKSNVLHIKPAYGVDTYAHFPIQYDLNSYKGKTITITMSMDIYLKKSARIAWQINSKDPYYPVVCGRVSPSYEHPDPKSGPAYAANTWHTITGSLTYTVPNTDPTEDDGKRLYLSGQQIEGAEAYFANATITITETP